MTRQPLGAWLVGANDRGGPDDCWTGYNPAANGCSFPSCKSQDTVTLDGYTGRRCAAHPPQPPWLTLADLGRFRDAFQALRSHLTARARGWL